MTAVVDCSSVADRGSATTETSTTSWPVILFDGSISSVSPKELELSATDGWLIAVAAGRGGELGTGVVTRPVVVMLAVLAVRAGRSGLVAGVTDWL